jgi:hypothetical protein
MVIVDVRARVSLFFWSITFVPWSVISKFNHSKCIFDIVNLKYYILKNIYLVKINIK